MSPTVLLSMPSIYYVFFVLFIKFNRAFKTSFSSIIVYT